MKKVCLCLRMPALYREAIHRLIESKYDCEWHFKRTNTTIKLYNTGFLRNVYFHDVINLGKGFSYTKGILPLLFCKKNNTFIISGITTDLSGMLLILLKKIFYKKKKVFLWSHGWYGKEKWFEYFIKKNLYSCVDGIFCYGSYAKKLMISVGVPEHKLNVIHNSLDHDKQVRIRESGLFSDIYFSHFHNDYPVIIFIGRLTKVKRLDILVKAVAELIKMGEYYNLVFVGDGIERNVLQDLVEKLSIEKHVWFVGECYDERQNAVYIYNSDLCVAPGNVGLTAMHTMVYGTPVITHNDFKNQMPEFEAIKEGKTGDFFYRGDINSLADKIKKWFMKNKNYRDYIRQYCYNEIDEFWTPKYQIKIFEKVI